MADNDSVVGGVKVNFGADTSALEAGARKAEETAQRTGDAISSRAEPGAKQLATAFAKGAAPVAAILASVDRMWVSIKQSAEAAEQLGAELKAISDAQSVSLAEVDKYASALQNVHKIAEAQNRALEQEIASRSIIVDLVEAAFGNSTDTAKQQQIEQAKANALVALGAKQKNDADAAAAKDIADRDANIRRAAKKGDDDARQAAIQGRREAEEMNRQAFLDTLEGEERERAEAEIRLSDLRIRLRESSTQRERELIAETIAFAQEAEEKRLQKLIEETEAAAKESAAALSRAYGDVIRGLQSQTRGLFQTEDLAVQIQRVGDYLETISLRERV